MKFSRNASFGLQFTKYTSCHDKKRLWRKSGVMKLSFFFFFLQFAKNCSQLGQNKPESIKKSFKRKSRLAKILEPDSLSLTCDQTFFIIGRTFARKRTPDRRLNCQAHRSHKTEKLNLCQTITFMIRYCGVICCSTNTPK